VTKRTGGFPDIVDDAAVEGPEDFFAQITSVSAGLIGADTVDVTILDNDHPANDNFASAATISGASGTASGTTINGTTQPGEPQNGFESIWFDWTAPATTTAVFDTETSDFPTVLSVYTGSTLQNLALIGTSFENPLTFSGQGQLVFAATAGTVYHIQVARNTKLPGDPGNAVLNWSTTPNGGFELALE
jgi:hypothetical protein